MTDLIVRFPEPCSERWEDMAPRGCNRHCASCDRVIHDLATMTAAQVDDLLASEEAPCVRAVLGPDGAVRTRTGPASRRIVAAVGVTATLATAACQSLPGQFPPYGNISGTVRTSCWNTRVIATDANGKSYAGKVDRRQNYLIRYLPHGTYDLTFVDSLQQPLRGGTVVVTDGTVVAPPIVLEDDCIIIGTMQRVDNRG